MFARHGMPIESNTQMPSSSVRQSRIHTIGAAHFFSSRCSSAAASADKKPVRSVHGPPGVLTQTCFCVPLMHGMSPADSPGAFVGARVVAGGCVTRTVVEDESVCVDGDATVVDAVVVEWTGVVVGGVSVVVGGSVGVVGGSVGVVGVGNEVDVAGADIVVDGGDGGSEVATPKSPTKHHTPRIARPRIACSTFTCAAWVSCLALARRMHVTRASRFAPLLNSRLRTTPTTAQRPALDTRR